MQSRLGALALIAALAACAAIAMIVSNTSSSPVELASKGLGLKQSDLDLLKGAMHSEAKEKHRACVKECTTRACKAKCSKIISDSHADKAKQAKVAKVASKTASKKVSLGLKKSDLKLLADADKRQQHDMVKKCAACMTKECKDNCKSMIIKAKKAHAKAEGHKATKKLGLKAADLKLLADAQKRQRKEGDKAKYMAKMDNEAYDHRNGGSSGSAGLSINHQPGDSDGQGDWAPGMRANALAQLKQEQKQAAQTARFAEQTDNDDSWDN